MSTLNKLIATWDQEHIPTNHKYVVSFRRVYRDFSVRWVQDWEIDRDLNGRTKAINRAKELSQDDNLTIVTEDGVTIYLFQDGTKIWGGEVSNGDNA